MPQLVRPRSLSIGLLLTVAPSVCAQNCILSDDFNDGTTAQTWLNFSTDETRLRSLEQNGRLEFPAPTNNPGFNIFAGRFSDGWQIDMTQDWAVSVRYRLNHAPPTMGDTGIGFIVAFEIDESNPALFTGYSLSGGTYQSMFGAYPYEITRLWSDGNSQVGTEVFRSYIESTVYIWYDAETGCISHNDTLYVPFVTTCGVRDLSTLTTARLGMVAYSFGQVPSSPGSQNWGDDFCLIDGVVVGDQTGACCLGTSCLQTIASACDGVWLGAGSSCSDASACSPPCPADINGDGLVDGADLNTLLGSWGTSTAAADLNDDGLVDGADLNLLLGAWGICP